MFKEEIETEFGSQALDFGLFYQIEYALRFELSLGGSSIDQFSVAYDRGRRVLSRAFNGAKRFIFIVSYFGTGSFLSNVSVFRSLKSCGLRISRPYECWAVSKQNKETFLPDERTILAFEGTRDQVPYALWGVLAAELSVKPSLTCLVHIAAPDIGILAHPYDDRGMDVIGSNLPRLKALYSEFNTLLLDYDREKMTKTVGTL